MLVDDVITAGTAIPNRWRLFRLMARRLLVYWFRWSSGTGARRDFGDSGSWAWFNCKVISIITLKDLIAYLEESRKWRNIWRRLRPIAKSLAFKKLAGWKVIRRHITATARQLRPAGVKIIRRAVFKFAADKSDSIPSQKARIWLASRVSSVCNLHPHAFSFHAIPDAAALHTLEQLVDTPLQAILFKHQRRPVRMRVRPGLRSPKPRSSNQSDAGALWCLSHLSESGWCDNQAIFDKLNQAIEHAGLTGEWRYSAASETPTEAASFAVVYVGFHRWIPASAPETEVFPRTVPFRSLFFCHVTKYPWK